MIKSRRFGNIRSFIGNLYGPDLHAKRLDALLNATQGVTTGASPAVLMIGQLGRQVSALSLHRAYSLDARCF